MATKKAKSSRQIQSQKTTPQSRTNQPLSSVRIIGGVMRGRKIYFAAEQGLRPTLDRIRETLFNWLVADIAQSNCLDLFAGSGALGFEAISRGAASVTFVDASSNVATNLNKNLAELKTNSAKVIIDNAANFLANNTEKFDLVFLDPPFDKGLLPHTLENLIPHLNTDALVYIEQEVSSKTPEYSQQWRVLKSKKTSRFTYQLLGLHQIKP